MGFWQKLWLREITNNKLCDVVATDAHNNSIRKCHMKACYEYLSMELGEEFANALRIETPASLLGL